MFRANDSNGNSIFIDDADKNNKYFCPACEEPLIAKIFGTRKKHCFSHFPNTECKDNWKYEPMSEWHSSWQEHFNKENREVWIKGENESHRADVYINDTVIEFQHSRISNVDFNKRNKFYTSCNKNVIWIFDMKKQISLNEDGTFNWEKGNLFENTFVDFINYNNKVSIYFEIDKTINDSSALIPIINFDKRCYFKFKTFNYTLGKCNFLKDYVDLSHIEKIIKQKIYSITELLNIEKANINNSRVVGNIVKPKPYNTRSGPREWYITNSKNYNKKWR